SQAGVVDAVTARRVEWIRNSRVRIQRLEDARQVMVAREVRVVVLQPRDTHASQQQPGRGSGREVEILSHTVAGGPERLLVARSPRAEPLEDQLGIIGLLLIRARAVVHGARRLVEIATIPQDGAVVAVEHGHRRTLLALTVRDVDVDTTTHDPATQAVTLAG